MCSSACYAFRLTQHDIESILKALRAISKTQRRPGGGDHTGESCARSPDPAHRPRRERCRHQGADRDRLAGRGANARAPRKPHPCSPALGRTRTRGPLWRKCPPTSPLSLSLSSPRTTRACPPTSYLATARNPTCSTCSRARSLEAAVERHQIGVTFYRDPTPQPMSCRIEDASSPSCEGAHPDLRGRWQSQLPALRHPPHARSNSTPSPHPPLKSLAETLSARVPTPTRSSPCAHRGQPTSSSGVAGDRDHPNAHAPEPPGGRVPAPQQGNTLLTCKQANSKPRFPPTPTSHRRVGCGPVAALLYLDANEVSPPARRCSLA